MSKCLPLLAIIIFCSLTASNSLLAQNINNKQTTLNQSGSISGNLVNKNQAIEFASVTLASIQDSNKVLFYEATDTLGKFSFLNLSLGEYILKIKLVGYQPFSVKISLAAEKKEYRLDNFSLLSQDNELSKVIVSAQKKMIEKTSEGFIINTSNNITQIGGTATDLLKATPTVAVDNDGVVTLRGKTPLILINGRNSSLANTDQIAASSIESIEIINNASSKYDANAESGIINIRLKKNKQAGTNGAIALGSGFGSKARANTSLLLNNKVGKFNWGLGYDNRFAGRTRKIESNRTNYNLVDNYSIVQNRNDKRVERLQNLKLNADYTPNDLNTFSIEVIGKMEGQDNDEDLLSTMYKKNKIFHWSWDNNINTDIISKPVDQIRQIRVDTDGAVNDRHWGEDGHKSMASYVIEKLIPKII